MRRLLKEHKLKSPQTRRVALPAAGPLDVITLEIITPLPKTKQRNLYTIIMIGSYKKLQKAVSTSNRLLRIWRTIF